jgi:hypothetical protein
MRAAIRFMGWSMLAYVAFNVFVAWAVAIIECYRNQTVLEIVLRRERTLWRCLIGDYY